MTSGPTGGHEHRSLITGCGTASDRRSSGRGPEWELSGGAVLRQLAVADGAHRGLVALVAGGRSESSDGVSEAGFEGVDLLFLGDLDGVFSGAQPPFSGRQGGVLGCRFCRIGPWRRDDLVGWPGVFGGWTRWSGVVGLNGAGPWRREARVDGGGWERMGLGVPGGWDRWRRAGW